MNLARKLVLSLTLASFGLTFGSGCLGHFALTTSVRKFNLDTVESQWGREILFLALYVVPVYPICAFADILVVNSIEFWTETNPVSGERAITLSQRALPPDSKSAIAMRDRGDAAGRTEEPLLVEASSARPAAESP
jgi:hypothetical protein